jgi:hypothetical protein
MQSEENKDRLLGDYTALAAKPEDDDYSPEQ